MSRAHLLQQLLQTPGVWRLGQVSAPGHRVVATGFQALDHWIGGGWPLGVLTEVLLETNGIGELGLVMPALARLCSGAGHQECLQPGQPVLQSLQSAPASLAWSAFIAPPHIPYAPAFASHGLDVSRLLVVRPRNSTDALWSMEQALRSGLFAAVLGWFVCIDMPALRRLQLAAEAGMCWALMFRPARFARDASPAALRILLEPEDNAVLLQVLRNRYGQTGSLSVQC